MIYAMKNRLKINRIGLTAGKAVGNAVKRNRVKRLIRESYLQMEKNLKLGYDLVIVARGRCVGKSLNQISRDMEYAMRKLELVEKSE